MSEAWVQALGTLITIAGLVGVAPEAVGRLLPRAWRRLREWGRRTRGWLARFIPFLRRSVNVGAATAAFSVAGSATGTVRPGYSVTQDLGEQIKELREQIRIIYLELDGLSALVRQQHADHDARLAELRATLERVVREFEQQTRSAEELNTRGFPLAAAGALLAGCPWWFDEFWPWSVLIALLAFGALVSLVRTTPYVARGFSRAAVA